MLIVCIVSVIGSVILFTQMPSSREGYQVFRMMSMSMEPAILNGNYILVDKTVDAEDIVAAPYPSGDIIAFKRGSETVVHRAIAKEMRFGKIYFATKGDRNIAPDGVAVSEDSLVGKVVNTDFGHVLFMYSFCLWPIIITAIVSGVLSLFFFVSSHKGRNRRKTEQQTI